MRDTEAKKYITAIASQRALFSSTTRSVSRGAARRRRAGFSSEPNTSAIAPITRALADRGTQSERMGETVERTGRRHGSLAKPPAGALADGLPDRDHGRATRWRRTLAAMTLSPAPDAAVAAALALDLLAARPFVALTGAGLSTDSGIPDYRGPGSPARMPMTYQEFVSRPGGAAALLGAQPPRLVAGCGGAEPNAGHRALAALEAAGRIGC